MDNISKNLTLFAPVILRVGMSALFLWFGASQIMDPVSWVGFVPQSIIDMTGLAATTLVYMNATFEIVFGSALLLGFFTRWAAFFLALHLIDITYIVGLDAIGMRDAGLAVAATAVWLYGSDWLTLDRFMKRGQFKEKAYL